MNKYITWQFNENYMHQSIVVVVVIHNIYGLSGRVCNIALQVYWYLAFDRYIGLNQENAYSSGPNPCKKFEPMYYFQGPNPCKKLEPMYYFHSDFL